MHLCGSRTHSYTHTHTHTHPMHADPSSLTVSQIYTQSHITHADPPTQPPTLPSLCKHTNTHCAEHDELCLTCAVCSVEFPIPHVTVISESTNLINMKLKLTFRQTWYDAIRSRIHRLYILLWQAARPCLLSSKVYILVFSCLCLQTHVHT